LWDALVLNSTSMEYDITAVVNEISVETILFEVEGNRNFLEISE
jgi:hypothetical protein